MTSFRNRGCDRDRTEDVRMSVTGRVKKKKKAEVETMKPIFIRLPLTFKKEYLPSLKYTRSSARSWKK